MTATQPSLLGSFNAAADTASRSVHTTPHVVRAPAGRSAAFSRFMDDAPRYAPSRTLRPLSIHEAFDLGDNPAWGGTDDLRHEWETVRTTYSQK